MIRIPNFEQIMLLHEKIAARTGGSAEVRERGLVESGLLRAEAGFGGVEIYDTVEKKAAAVCCGLIGNHGFVDGNKRTGVAAMLLILKMNDIPMNYTQAELTRFGLDAAQGRVSVEDALAWIEAHRA